MVAVTAVAGMLALVAGRGAGTAWVVLAVLAGQLFIGWTNDYLDRDRDQAANRADKPIARGEIDARTVAVAAVVALVAVVPLSLASGVPATIVHLVGIGSATAYNVALKSTVLSPLPYALGFSLVPAFVTLGLTPSHWPPVWVMVTAGLVGLGGHFAQARPDVAGDRVQGVLGMPQVAGERASGILAAILLAAGALLIAAASRNVLPLVALPTAAGVAVTAPRTAYVLTLATAAVTTVVFLAVAGQALR